MASADEGDKYHSTHLKRLLWEARTDRQLRVALLTNTEVALHEYGIHEIAGTRDRLNARLPELQRLEAAEQARNPEVLSQREEEARLGSLREEADRRAAIQKKDQQVAELGREQDKSREEIRREDSARQDVNKQQDTVRQEVAAQEVARQDAQNRRAIEQQEKQKSSPADRPGPGGGGDDDPPAQESERRSSSKRTSDLDRLRQDEALHQQQMAQLHDAASELAHQRDAAAIEKQKLDLSPAASRQFDRNEFTHGAEKFSGVIQSLNEARSTQHAQTVAADPDMRDIQQAYRADMGNEFNAACLQVTQPMCEMESSQRVQAQNQTYIDGFREKLAGDPLGDSKLASYRDGLAEQAPDEVAKKTIELHQQTFPSVQMDGPGFSGPGGTGPPRDGPGGGF